MQDQHANLLAQTVGHRLIIDEKYEYSDLDELIVNHVKAMARRVEELMAHEKFKKDDDELRECKLNIENKTLILIYHFTDKFLTNFVSANPTKSIYGFALNRKKPGHFNLSFLAKKGSSIQTWVRSCNLFDPSQDLKLCIFFKPIRVAPEAYYLFDAAAAGVSELCDAFKVR